NAVAPLARYRMTGQMSSSLKKFMRKRPDSSDLAKAIQELESDTPRAAAILAATLLEDILLLSLLSAMRPLSQEEEDRLFVGLAPLSSFSAKIQLGYAIKIYGSKTRHDLDTIREIRNAFAHVVTSISFDTTEISDRCTGFHCLKPPSEAPGLTSRQRFTLATKIIMTRVH